jgi:hypothetical protein
MQNWALGNFAGYHMGNFGLKRVNQKTKKAGI